MNTKMGKILCQLLLLKDNNNCFVVSAGELNSGEPTLSPVRELEKLVCMSLLGTLA